MKETPVAVKHGSLDGSEQVALVVLENDDKAFFDDVDKVIEWEKLHTVCSSCEAIHNFKELHEDDGIIRLDQGNRAMLFEEDDTLFIDGDQTVCGKCRTVEAIAE